MGLCVYYYHDFFWSSIVLPVTHFLLQIILLPVSIYHYHILPSSSPAFHDFYLCLKFAHTDLYLILYVHIITWCIFHILMSLYYFFLRLSGQPSMLLYMLFINHTLRYTFALPVPFVAFAFALPSLAPPAALAGRRRRSQI